MICTSCGSENIWEHWDGTNTPAMICFDCGYIYYSDDDQTGLDIGFTDEEEDTE